MGNYGSKAAANRHGKPALIVRHRHHVSAQISAYAAKISKPSRHAEVLSEWVGVSCQSFLHLDSISVEMQRRLTSALICLTQR